MIQTFFPDPISAPYPANKRNKIKETRRKREARNTLMKIKHRRWKNRNATSYLINIKDSLKNERCHCCDFIANFWRNLFSPPLLPPFPSIFHISPSSSGRFKMYCWLAKWAQIEVGLRGVNLAICRTTYLGSLKFPGVPWNIGSGSHENNHYLFFYATPRRV